MSEKKETNSSAEKENSYEQDHDEENAPHEQGPGQQEVSNTEMAPEEQEGNDEANEPPEGQEGDQEAIEGDGQQNDEEQKEVPAIDVMDSQKIQQITLEELEKLLEPKAGRNLDHRILDFIRLLEEFRTQCEESGQYKDAKRAELKIKFLRRRECYRQQLALKSEQVSEIQSVESAQKQQFNELSDAWDNIMADYEEAALVTIQKLKDRQRSEMEELRESVRADLNKQYKQSCALLDMRKRERMLVKLKNYEAAEVLKEKADRQEDQERQVHEGIFLQRLTKLENQLRARQKQQMAALLDRIQRDRREQLKHRMNDSQRLLQRSKNIRKHLQNKQVIEQKRSLQNVQREISIKTAK